MACEARLAISAAGDIVNARHQGRVLAARLGFSPSEATLIAAAVSEVARNILEHARQGELLFDVLDNGRRRGLQITARDQGPGIANIPQAMEYGFSSGNGAGVGLPAAQWLMDEFEIASAPQEGTTVTMKKWVSHLAKETR